MTALEERTPADVGWTAPTRVHLWDSVFGTVAQFALASGLLGTTSVPPATSFGVFALIGFTAGFSERFATDMIERAGQALAGAESRPPEPTRPAARENPDPTPSSPPSNSDQRTG